MGVANASASSSLKILHIEDSDIDARFIRETLDESQLDICSINVFSSVNDALDFLSEHDVDLVLLDLNITDSNGLDTLQTIRANFPSLAILIITGSDDQDIALQSVTMGAQDYLVKDFISQYTITRSIQYVLERNKHEQDLFKIANTDSLTSLPNRGHFTRFLSQYLLRSSNIGKDFALLYINCDKFKVINDTMGHSVADDFLIKLSTIIRANVSESDFIARMGGDEFVVALNLNTSDSLTPKNVASNIINSVHVGISLRGGEKVHATCSIGIAKVKGNNYEITAETLMNQAVSAMFAAKKRGGDRFNIYNKTLETEAAKRVKLLKLIKGGFKKGEFYLNHQVIYDGANQQPVGMESLMRWKTSKGEFIPPLDFIPIMEETGLIFTVGVWAIHQACLDFLLLKKHNLLPDNAWVSVNVSPLQLQDESFSSKVSQILKALSMPAQKLHLEITETLMMEKKDTLLKELRRLKKLGCRLSIDDFGVGYSSMNYLKELPFDTLKIDQSFILPFSNKKSEKAILKAMIALAHNLNKRVVAEGVENKEAAAFLSEQKCDFLQGYHFAKPASIEDVFERLQRAIVLPPRNCASS